MAAGLFPPTRSAGRSLLPAVVAAVLAAVVGLMTVYVAVREANQPDTVREWGQLGSVDEPAAAPVGILSQVAPEAGPAKLMSIDDMRRLAGDD